MLKDKFTKPYFGIAKQPPFFSPLLFIAALLPILLIGAAMMSDLFMGSSWLGSDPVKEGEHMLGEWTLRYLFGTLLITPLRSLTGWNWLAKHRRTLGLFAFASVSVHLLTWAFLDVQILVSELVGWMDVWTDLTKRPYLAIGMMGFLLMVPLTWTSTKASIKKLGKKWTRLHRWVYVIPVLGCIHYIMAVKKDIEEPLMYMAFLAGILIWRGWIGWQRGRAHAAPAPTSVSASASA